MSVIGTLLANLETALIAAAPTRVVTRTLKDFSDRRKEDLMAGVFTLVHRGQKDMRSYQEHLQVLLVGQVLVAEKAAAELKALPETVEEAELLMIDEIRRWADGVQGAQVSLVGWSQSQQIEAPFGWVAVEIDIGPLDFSAFTLDPATLDNFLTFRANYDLAPMDGQIDATDSVTLPAAP